MHDTRSREPSLLLVAHGTASAVGAATTRGLVQAIAAARPSIAVSLCFLDVVAPRLPETLADLDGPAVLVPLLLSTGFHVQADIPAAVAQRSDIAVARHLGPHELLVDVLVDRMDAPAGLAAVALVGAGSSRSEAAAELAAVGDLLSARLDVPVTVLSMADDLPTRIAGLPRPAAVATYLLAEGQFVTTLRAAADGVAAVADPIGIHPALVRLVWQRFDDAVDAAE